MLFGYPQLGRYGLGHGLIAWARCVVWSESTGSPMLAPIWIKPRLGPYLRRERDKREYFKLFNSNGAIGDPERSWRLLTSKKIRGIDGFFAEDIFAEDFLRRHRNKRGDTLLVFENSLADNTEKHFPAIRPHWRLVGRRLRMMVRDRYLPPETKKPFLAVHVRLGDFMAAPPGTSTAGHSIRRPIGWYVDAVSAARRAAGSEMAIVVYSDGTDEDLRALLALPNIVRSPHRESITDMLEMSQARAIVGTSSGFAFWAAYLGQKPRINYPGTLMTRALEHPELETEFDGAGELPPVIGDFIQQAAYG